MNSFSPFCETMHTIDWGSLLLSSTFVYINGASTKSKCESSYLLFFEFDFIARIQIIISCSSFQHKGMHQLRRNLAKSLERNSRKEYREGIVPTGTPSMTSTLHQDNDTTFVSSSAASNL
mmetsp:Transcript_32615/g.49911  ORF Transcript_32615/g.49911 Transcript_32615/m.49911 type:complete len:120 (+) Transcript_32615:122-481(+)